jgi:hypothetical protein
MPSPRLDAEFGSSVAIDGDTIVVGAPGEVVFGPPGFPDSRGTAWVFVRNGARWDVQGWLVFGGSSVQDAAGEAVAVAGNRIALGIPGAPRDGTPGQGAVAIFIRSQSEWFASAFLQAGETGSSPQFGSALAMEGGRLVVGSRSGDAAWVFDLVAGAWARTAHLSSASPGDGFGTSVALSGDRLLVGAPFRSIGGATARGAADFFEYRAGAWVLRSQQAAPEGVAQDLFGWRVALDGDTALVGNLTSGGGPPRPADAVHVFEWRGSNWRLDRRWRPLDLTTGEDFGSALDLDGSTAVIGAPRVAGEVPWGNPEEGVAYVYTQVPDLLFFDDLESDAAPAVEP